MKTVAALLVALLLSLPNQVFAESATGVVKGGHAYVLPGWFKTSFLDFQSDAEEARGERKHVMVFMHLDECPYCSRMLDESFSAGDNSEFIRNHFDVVGVNVRGDLEVRWADGETYSERALARKLRAIATPTVVFLDPDGNRVLQLTGYRDPGAFRRALDFVESGTYRTRPFADYLAQIEQPEIYDFLHHPQLERVTYFKGYSKPLAILFEDRGCAECARFHEKTLNHPEVLEEMKRFLFVRLDADSTRLVIDVSGRKTTPAEWIKRLGLTYRPALILFNEGRPVYRVDGRLYHFHFKEALHYVSGAYYRKFDTLSEFRAAYRRDLLASGKDIDFGE